MLMDNDLNYNDIEKRIYTIRGVQVMLDSDLAKMYNVETKVFNQAVNRNKKRFPEEFCFRLTSAEWLYLRSQFVTSSLHGGRRYMPFVFTEQGVSMLSAILRSPIAIKVSIAIINAFVEMRKLISFNAGIFQKVDKIEQKQLQAAKNFEQLFKALDNKYLWPDNGVFYDGQIYDAYVLVADIIRSADESIIIIDNYIDDSVLTMLTKRASNVNARIYAQNISKSLSLDIKKHNEQYPSIQVNILNKSHDRFIIIDNQRLYHIGASLKDLGKKWFAFSRMDSLVHEVLGKLKTN